MTDVIIVATVGDQLSTTKYTLSSCTG